MKIKILLKGIPILAGAVVAFFSLYPPGIALARHLSETNPMFWAVMGTAAAIFGFWSYGKLRLMVK